MTAIGRLLTVATGCYGACATGRHYGVRWSNRMQAGGNTKQMPGQVECNWMVKSVQLRNLVEVAFNGCP